MKTNEENQEVTKNDVGNLADVINGDKPAVAALAVPDKRAESLQAVLDGIKARDLGEAAPVFKQVEEGSKITLLPDNEVNKTPWPSISIGRNGGIIINELRSYPGDKPGTLNTAVFGEQKLAAQMARDQKRTDEAKAAEEAAAKKTPQSVPVEASKQEEQTAA